MSANQPNMSGPVSMEETRLEILRVRDIFLRLSRLRRLVQFAKSDDAVFFMERALEEASLRNVNIDVLPPSIRGVVVELLRERDDIYRGWQSSIPQMEKAEKFLTRWQEELSNDLEHMDFLLKRVSSPPASEAITTQRMLAHKVRRRAIYAAWSTFCLFFSVTSFAVWRVYSEGRLSGGSPLHFEVVITTLVILFTALIVVGDVFQVAREHPNE